MADQRLIWGERTVVDRIGGAAYDYAVEREWLARPSGLALWGTDTRVLYDSIRLIGDLPDGSAVLDVPCGGGLALRGLRSDQRVRYVAADISTDMLARARRRAADLGRDDIEFTEADIERMPFDDKEFDLCVSFNGLHCLPDPAAAVREISSRAAGWSATWLCAAPGCVRIWRSAPSTAQASSAPAAPSTSYAAGSPTPD
ncbi:class I SAM-dependent methyltransferase [Mycobacterium sp.]|uniref:class I SAM-dependent methyltransferase n=1 Tax=Mycobacterium sp. TaxID=1785 RepID=UPI003C72DABC